MKAHETILQPIFEGTKQYVVPLFQRTYSWRQDNWKTLWDDILAIYTSETSRQHFLGAIVSMPVNMSPSGVNKYLLIDGQQRITTLFILLAALRDVACRKDERLSDQINELYLINKWAEGPNVLKLYPSQADREVFSAIINRKNYPLEERNLLIKAYTYFKQQLERKDPEGKTFDLARLHAIIMQELMVVDIVLDRDENPYHIFESLNAKGEPLTQADLVRNYLLMRITDSDDQEIAYREFWLPMQTSLGDELTKFIWRYLIKGSYSGKAIRLNEIYDEVKKRLQRAKSTQVVDMLMDMHTFSGYYLCLINPEVEPNKALRRRLERINRWDIKTCYPFLLNLYHDYRRKLLSGQDFCKIIEMIESFVVRRSFCRVPTNVLNKIFLGLYRSIDLSSPVDAVVLELLRREWPDDSSFKSAWLEFPIYTSGTSKCRYILDSLEEALTTNKEPVDLSNSQITIEHIMPQTLNEEWEQMLGERAGEIYDTYLDTVGNLTLTGKNSEMGNASLFEKREVFRKSNFAINKDLADVLIWNDETIRTRADKLFEKAVQIWPHPAGDSISNQSQAKQHSDGPTGKKPTGYSLFDTEYSVDTWREMLLNVLAVLAEKHEDEFIQKASNVNTGRRTHISVKPDGMHTPIRIHGSDYWVECNQNSKGVLNLIYRVLDALGESADVFEAYW